MNPEKTRFVKNALVFLVILVIIILIANVIYIKFVVNKTATYRKHLKYQEFLSYLPDNEIKYAFFGDSHFQKGIHPMYIKDAYNYADSGLNYLNLYFTLNEVLFLSDIKIQYIVLQVDPHNFCTKLDDARIRNSNNLRLYSQFIPMKDLKKLYDSPVDMILDVYYPVIGGGNELLDINAVEVNVFNLEGFLGTVGTLTNRSLSRDSEKKVALHFDKNKVVNEDNLEYFIKIIQLAKTHNITVVFLRMPLPRKYYQGMENNSIDYRANYRIAFNNVDKVLDDYYVFDYHDLYWENQHFFHDGDHLNMKGAIALSYKINIDLMSMENANITLPNGSGVLHREEFLSRIAPRLSK